MVAPLVALTAMLLASLAAVLHHKRCERLAPLAFGPEGRPRHWARLAPLLRIAACGALAWGAITLALLEPKVHRAEAIPEGKERHVVLVLDVSPSMRLEDAGAEKKQSRRKRSAVVLGSFFDRIPLELYEISVVAVYNGAKVVVEDTRDFEVVRNILDDLPMQYAFPTGKTRLFAGLEEAAKLAHPWNPRSATIILVSDGDTVPGTGMPKMPASVREVLVVGIGDPHVGKFIDGRHSRQDTATLRQIAARLGGVYHNGNQRHITSETISLVAGGRGDEVLEQLSNREYALMAVACGALVLSLLPLALHLGGTSWRPGVRTRSTDTLTRHLTTAERTS